VAGDFGKRVERKGGRWIFSWAGSNLRLSPGQGKKYIPADHADKKADDTDLNCRAHRVQVWRSITLNSQLTNIQPWFTALQSK